MRVKRISIQITSVLTILLGQNSFAALYEKDNRVDASQFPNSQLILNQARAIALVTPVKHLIPKNNGHFKLNTLTFAELQKKIDEPLCPEERFQNHVVVDGRGGSGFLIAPDLLITAGHVVHSESDCLDLAFIFDYSYRKSSTPNEVHPQNIARCEKLIYRVETDPPEPNYKLDFAIVKLKEPIFTRPYLKLQKEPLTKLGQDLWMLGHPMGLPLILSASGPTSDLSYNTYFRALIDTYKGNSGGPVMKAEESIVEGILFEGEPTDITIRGEWPSGCWYSKVYCLKPNTPGCDTHLYDGAAIQRSQVIRKTLDQLIPAWEPK